MDFFTHMLVGYLVAVTLGMPLGGLGVSEGVYLFGVLMAMLPDFDVILFPLARRFPMLRHHGFTHTVPFIAVASCIGAVVGARVYGLPFSALLAVGFASGMSHLLCDWFTNFSIPAFYPFTKKEYAFDAENAVNMYVMPLSILSMVGLWWLRVSKVPYEATYLPLVTLVGGAFLAYCAARVIIKFLVARKFSRDGATAQAMATMRIGTWYVELKNAVSGASLTTYLRYRIGDEAGVPKFFELDNLRAPARFPVDSDEKAVVASAGAVEKELGGKPDVAAYLQRDPAETPRWAVTWFQWRFGGGDQPVYRVDVRPEGVAGIQILRESNFSLWRLWS